MHIKSQKENYIKKMFWLEKKDYPRKKGKITKKRRAKLENKLRKMGFY